MLRRAVFSLSVIFLICLPDYFARVNGGASTWIRRAFGILIGADLRVFAFVNGLGDLAHADICDIPVLETLLVVITTFGVVLAFKRAKNKRFQSKRYVLITLFFTSLAYGGWLWSEILYDQQVINSFLVLQHHPPSPKPSLSPCELRTLTGHLDWVKAMKVTSRGSFSRRQMESLLKNACADQKH